MGGPSMCELEATSVNVMEVTKKDMELTTAPRRFTRIDETAKPQEENDDDTLPTNSWDPMSSQLNSLQNLNCPDAQSTVTGVIDFRGSLCPHANSTGQCYKGFRCPHKYHIDQKIIKKNPKLATPMVTTAVAHFSKLQSQSITETGMTFLGTVTSASSPADFFAVPDSSFTCACHNKEDLQEDELTTMTKELEMYYGRHQFRNATSFAILELLAVKYEFRQKKSHFRAVVLHELLLEHDEPPEVKCFLLDLGHTVTVPLFNVAPLPQLFCHKPPLAYRCSLYGISPVYIHYSSKVIRQFFALINRQNLIFIVRRPFRPNEDACSMKPWLSRPIEVEMRVCLDKKNPLVYTDVTDMLTGVLKWNKKVERPLAWKNYTNAQIEILGLSSNTTSKTRHSEMRAVSKYLEYREQEHGDEDDN